MVRVILVGLSILYLAIFSVSCSTENDPGVTANENIYINELYSAGNDWIEIYNDNDISKNIGGYFIYDDVANKYALPANTTIPSKGFLVLDCDGTGVGLFTNFKLSSSGETIYFENTSSQVIDKVVFPAMVNGQSYGRYPDGSSNFAISGNITQGSTNGTSEAPAISSVTRLPLVPGLTDIVAVQTGLAVTTGITSVKLFYRIDGGGYTEVVMSKSTGNLYDGNIPALNGVGKIDYYIEAKNTLDKTTFSPADAPTSTYSYILNIDALPNLKVNEFLAANTTCCPDKVSGTDEFDDWVEIYNAGGTVVNVGGMYLSDNKDNPFNFQIPATNSSQTTIQPGGFLLIWADSDPSQGVLHTDFKLSATGDDIGIYYLDGRTIDVYTFGPQTENVSQGRTIDGGGNWISFTSPTPGQSNQ